MLQINPCWDASPSQKDFVSEVAACNLTLEVSESQWQGSGVASEPGRGGRIAWQVLVRELTKAERCAKTFLFDPRSSADPGVASGQVPSGYNRTLSSTSLEASKGVRGRSVYGSAR